MNTKYVDQLLENAEKLLDAHKRTGDAVLLEMVASMIALARVALDEQQSFVMAPDGSVQTPAGTFKPTRPWHQDGVFAYAAPGIGDSRTAPYDPRLTTTDSTEKP